MPPALTDLQPGEYVAVRLAQGGIEGAELTATYQYREGFRAAVTGAPYAAHRPANWGRGWCDAFAMQETAPALAMRDL